MKKQRVLEIKNIKTEAVIENLKRVVVGEPKRRENHYFKNFVKDVNDILKANGYKDGIFFDEFQRNSQNYLYQASVKRTENQYKLVLKTYLLLSNQQGKKLVRNQSVVIDKNGQINYHYNDIVGKYEVGINHDFSTVVNTLPVDKEKEKAHVKFVQALFAENHKTNNGKSK